MKFSSRAKRFVTTAVAIASMSSGLALTSFTSAGAATTKLDIPLSPGDYPNYIWPFTSGGYFTVTNMNEFQSLMYRPLYWVGKGSDTTIQTDLSTGALPEWASDSKSLKITMKGWKFSNGETVDARSVVFFLNMYRAAYGAYGGYVSGMGIPDQVKSAKASGNEVTIELKTAVNHNWFLYSFLTEITPMPRAWDRLSASAAAGSAGCGNNLSSYTKTAARAVCGVDASPSINRRASGLFKVLDTRSQNTATFTASDPYWSVVDGPWKLSSFDTRGDKVNPIVFVPNSTYGGPQKAKVGQLIMHPFTSIDAERTALATGKLDSGYVNPTDVNPGPKPGVAGSMKWSALKGKFTVRTGPSWSFNYAYYNFDSKTGATPLTKQLYIRQALQASIDQVSIIQHLYNGYGIPTYGPIPSMPANDFAGTSFKNPYPFNLKVAKKYLTDNGWTIPKTGAATCSKSTGCGTGIPKGTRLKLRYEYYAATPTTNKQMVAEQSQWAKIGIQMTLVPIADPNVVSSDCLGDGSSGTGWQICQYGGWLYAPDYYPSGELLFFTDAVSNPGHYSDAKMDAIITATTQGGEALKTRYARYAAEQVPYMYQPTSTGTGVISTKLKGVLPPSPVSAYLPEYISK
ncbi:MAG: ABC transporter substrate-binding protein [Actinobacteria bacterium]|nr:ABC transporter substrate-binding protein [Actinomycetota bacterium]